MILVIIAILMCLVFIEICIFCITAINTLHLSSSFKYLKLIDITEVYDKNDVYYYIILEDSHGNKYQYINTDNNINYYLYNNVGNNIKCLMYKAKLGPISTKSEVAGVIIK